MTSTNAIEIINAICEKIGIVYDKAIGLVPYIAKYNLVQDITALVIGIAVALVGWRMWHRGDRLTKADMEEHEDTDWGMWAEDHLGWLVFGGLALLVGTIIVGFSGADLMQWIFNPEVSALKWALEFTK